MSTPINKLDKFRTYSYHHFMIAANNTEILRQIEEKEITFDSLTRLKHGEMISAKNAQNGGAVMVLNSAVDSKFYIESMDYSTIFNKSKDSEDRQTQATTMKMVIKETRGATFINFLRKVSDEILLTSYSSVCFMLITFFAGHSHNDKTEIISIDPITLTLLNMDSSFDHTGGTHSLEMAGMSNGAPIHMPSTFYVNRNLNLATNENSILLKGMIKDLEGKLNAQLEMQYVSVLAETNGNGRQVKYKITIPKDWEHYTIKCTTKDNYIEKLFEKEKKAVQADETARTQAIAENKKNKAGPESDRFRSHVNTAVKTTIVQVLHEIFKHCDQIHQSLVDNLKLKSGEIPKIHQIVSSITSDQNLITVHFDVINYYLPRIHTDAEKAVIENKTKNLSEKDKAAIETSNTAIRHKKEEDLGIIFEYIYSGMNSDIIQFDIKANHTNIIIQNDRPGITKATRDSVNPASSDPKETKDPNKKSSTVLAMRKYDAVYLPELAAEAQHGYVYASPDSAKLRDDYVMTLARLMALTTSSSHLVIRGNPVFLNTTIKHLMPHNDSKYESKLVEMDKEAKKRAETQRGKFDPTKTTGYMAEYSGHIPMFVKVVIRTPNDDLVADKEGKVHEYIDFWYQGYYRILQIENKFVNGEFIQELYIAPWDLNDLDTTKT